jgi:hypothetical protein
MFFFLDENKEKIEPSPFFFPIFFKMLRSDPLLHIDFWMPEKLPYEFQKGRHVEIQSKGEEEVLTY